MPSPIREELIVALSELGRLFPDWRSGQMLANIASSAGRLDAGGVWELEDDEALAAARRLIERNGNRLVESAHVVGPVARQAELAGTMGISG